MGIVFFPIVKLKKTAGLLALRASTQPRSPPAFLPPNPSTAFSGGAVSMQAKLAIICFQRS